MPDVSLPLAGSAIHKISPAGFSLPSRGKGGASLFHELPLAGSLP